MRQIPLSQGLCALVDDEDYSALSAYKWHAHAGHGGSFYACRWVGWVGGKRVREFMHKRLSGLPNEIEIDHDNGNTLDNQKRNLRPATRSQNMQNRKPNKNGASRHKGVCWHKSTGKWTAAIQVNKKRKYLGLFESEEAAAQEYIEHAAKLFGEFNGLEQNDRLIHDNRTSQ